MSKEISKIFRMHGKKIKTTIKLTTTTKKKGTKPLCDSLQTHANQVFNKDNKTEFITLTRHQREIRDQPLSSLH